MRTARGGRGDHDDRGSAVIEFVFVAVVITLPLVYLLVAVTVVQRSRLAVTQAAREAGRAFATADTTADAPTRMAAAVRLAFASQGLPDDAEVRVVAAGAGCDAPPVAPELTPGAVFTICVRRHVPVPGVPRFLSGRGIVTVGEYTVHVDDFRVVPP